VISRQLIQLHGGHLTCHSEKDKGSTFQFTCKITLATADDHPSTEVYSKDKEHTLAAEGRHQPENGNSTNGSSRTLEGSPTTSDVAWSAAERTRILVVCPLKFTCTSIIHHIRATVQDPSLCEISTVSGCDEAVRELNSKGPRGKSFTHVIINLLEVSETAQLLQYAYAVTTARLVVITSPAQKTNINRALSSEEAVRKSVTFLEKPTKPSRYSNVFDPTKRREESYDTKMASAHAAIKTQRTVFHELGEFARGKHYRILVAEDNLVNQKVMAKFLVKAGFECDLAVDGVDCTAKFFAVQAGYYDLILCDLDMPRKDGFQTCVEIRAREKDNGHKPVPIVALSAYVMSDVAARCNEVGFTDYISKPVEFSVLKGEL
jgi:CheY-like chemotaxis protein